VIVWGKVTDDSLDSDGEIVDADFAAKALSDWYQGGAAVFGQHCEYYPPAGNGIALEVDPEDGSSIRAHVYEPTAVQHVLNGVYKDFSVGWYDPEYVRDPEAPNGRMVGGWAREVSLVDAGANPNAHIEGVSGTKEKTKVPRFVMAKSKAKGQAPDLFGLSSEPEARGAARIDEVPVTDETGDGITRALKRAMVYRAEKTLAAAHWYAAFKRDMDPDVGGGVDRDKLDPADFVLPDEGDGKFPVVTPADVSDAVSSWGRYKGSTTFEEFKSKLIALCKRKGPSFTAELPDSWGVKKGKQMKDCESGDCGKCPACTAKSTKAAAASGLDGKDPTEGNKACPTCKGSGTIMMGNRKCPDCEGAGQVPMDFKKAKKTKPVAAKQDDSNDDGVPDTDDDVSDAIDELMDATGDVSDAQDADTEDHPPTAGDDIVDDALDNVQDAVEVLDDAQDADEDNIANKEAPPVAPKAAKDAPPADSADATDDDAPPPSGDDGDPDDAMPANCDSGKCGKCKMCMKRKAKKDKKKAKRANKSRHVPLPALAAHDALCPVYAVDAESALKSIDPSYFATAYQMAKDKGRESDVTRAYDSLAAATKLSQMATPTFERLRTAAHKAMEAAYPTMTGTGFTLNSPDQFKRPFLSGATSDTPTGGFAIPTPGMAPTFGPSDFNRTSQIPNEARPSPTPGVSAASLPKSKKGSRKGKKDKPAAELAPPTSARVFYKNSDKGDGDVAAMLHDHIARNFPGICPMHDSADKDGGIYPNDVTPDDVMGQPDAMYQATAKPVPLPKPAGTNDGRLTPASTAGAAKAKGPKAPEKGADQGKARKAKANKSQKGDTVTITRAELEAFKAEVRTALRAPDPRARKARQTGTAFRPTPDLVDSKKLAEVHAKIKRLKSGIHSPNSQIAGPAIAQAMEELTPEQFAIAMVSDD
jgi:hypothetical protein